MPQGLQIFDANGGLQLTLSDRITRILGVITIGSVWNGSLTVDTQGGTLWFYIQNAYIPASNVPFDINMPLMEIVNGNTLKWSYPTTSGNKLYRVIYGLY